MAGSAPSSRRRSAEARGMRRSWSSDCWIWSAARELFAALFSEIGSEFYAPRLRRRSLDEVTIPVDRKGGAPAMLVRAGDERDLAAVEAMHARRSANAPIRASTRPRPMMHYALAKKRLLAGLGPPGSATGRVLRRRGRRVGGGLRGCERERQRMDARGGRRPRSGRRETRRDAAGAGGARTEPPPMPLIRAWWPRRFPCRRRFSSPIGRCRRICSWSDRSRTSRCRRPQTTCSIGTRITSEGSRAPSSPDSF